MGIILSVLFIAVIIGWFKIQDGRASNHLNSHVGKIDYGKMNEDRILFLNRLKWQTATGEMVEIQMFQADIYRFIFQKPLTKKCMVDFAEYVSTLSMEQKSSIMQIWVWLYQHDIKFKLIFSWNPRCPIKYNLKNLLSPKRINKQLSAFNHDDIMPCPLETIK